MRNLVEVFESLVNSFNNRETANFIDLRDLQRHIGDSDLFEEIVTDYNEGRATNFFSLRQLQELVEK
jgi:hypothetical protein